MSLYNAKTKETVNMKMFSNIYLKLGIAGSLMGCVSVSAGQPLLANILWLLFNPLMIIHNYRAKEKAQMWLWTIYVLIALYGVFHNWR